MIVYEKELKEVLVSWMNAPGSQDEGSPFKKVVSALETPLRKALEGPQQALEEGNEDDFLSVFLPLLADLNAQGSLPASACRVRSWTRLFCLTSFRSLV